MMRRQTSPRRWLIVNAAPDAELWEATLRLPRGSGILLLTALRPGDMRRLRHVAGLRGLIVIPATPRTAARIHNSREMSRALLRRPALILISPLHFTSSHPEWKPLPRMRAVALARLANRQAVALGGLNDERFRGWSRLGFVGWAGISAFRT